MTPGPASAADGREGRAVILLCALLAGFHFWAATVGWESLNLPGDEFRQAQTAISAYHIQQDNNFSLSYPTPVLGKPWSIPMEFPLYQWTVAGLSTATGLGLTPAGRAVSLACFYLTLPAVFLLLGRLGLGRSQRGIVLGLVLTCPLYIYYARAFLIETMALMFSAWFLVAFIKAVEGRSGRWLLLANIMGLGAGLVKVTTFLLFLLPAGLGVAWTLWLARPCITAPGGRNILTTAAWIAAATAVPFAASLWWIHWADSIKQLNPNAQFLLSSRLAAFNFGTAENRFSTETLGQHWHHVATTVVWPPVLAVGLLLAVTVSRHWWRPMLLCLGCYLAALALFPVLYSLHEYYGVANAIFLVVALGCALAGLEKTRLPRWVAAVVVLGVFAAQMLLYLQGFYPVQKQWSAGGSGLTEALREITDRNGVLVVAGDDWSSITPFFAQRRALMIHTGQQDQPAYLQAAFTTLADERIGAVVLAGELRSHDALRDRLSGTFALDRRAVFTWKNSTVYLPVESRTWAIRKLHAKPFDSVRMAEDALLPPPRNLVAEWCHLRDLTPAESHPFTEMNPAPIGFYSSFGPALEWRQGEPWFDAHPTTRLRFLLPAGRHRLSTKVMIKAGAYTASADGGEPPTDGVEIKLMAHENGLVPRVLYSRLLDPFRAKGDQGPQAIEVSFELKQAVAVDLFIGPGPRCRDMHDWISLGRLTFD